MSADWRAEIQQFLAFELRRIEIAQDEVDLQQGVASMYNAAVNVLRDYLTTELKKMEPHQAESASLSELADVIARHRPALCDYHIARQLKDLDRLSRSAADGMGESEKRKVPLLAEDLETLFTRMQRKADIDGGDYGLKFEPTEEKPPPSRPPVQRSQTEQVEAVSAQIREEVKKVFTSPGGQQLNLLALASLLVTFFVPFIGPIAGIVLARMAIKQISEEPNKYTGEKLARAGLAIGVLFTAGSVFYCCMMMFTFLTPLFENM